MHTPAPLPLVFLGPSLRIEAARRLCPAEYHPPVRRGDLDRLAGRTPRRIAIVDGAFHHSLAVTPNEVLRALDAGHRVYGAASMGALRAVELGYAGMIGVGQVFQLFASGRIDREDEVAVSFDPDTGQALSDALISMRAAFRRAAAAGLIDVETAAAAIAVAARLYYPSRTYRRVVEELPLAPARRGRLLRFLTTRATDLKAADTRALLRRLAREPAALPPPRPRTATAATLPPRPESGRAIPPLAALPPAPKAPGWTSVRTVPAARTNATLARLGTRFGVTRVADITGLDCIGIPCFSAVLPGLPPPGVSAYSGKSLDPEEARAGAQMEALEMALASDGRVPVRRATYDELAREAPALDPERLPIVGSETGDVRAMPFDWVIGWELVTGRPTWIPADAVYFRDGPLPPWRCTGNGLASGNCLVEALAHALAEVIERDAMTLHRLAVDYHHLPATMRRLGGRPREPRPPGLPLPTAPWYPFVDPRTLPGPLADAVTQIERAGAAVELRWVASDIAVPVVMCVIHEQHGSLMMTHGGSGAHPDATVAARRAVTEAVQSRATYIQGVREDLPEPAIAQNQRPGGGWFDPRAERIDFAALPSHAFGDVTADLRFMAEAVQRAGLRDILAVDLSHPELPFSVARVLVPGAEPLLDLNKRDRVSLGWRAHAVLDRRP